MAIVVSEEDRKALKGVVVELTVCLQRIDEQKEQMNVEDMIALASDAVKFAAANKIEDAMAKYNKINPA